LGGKGLGSWKDPLRLPKKLAKKKKYFLIADFNNFLPN